MHYSLTPLGGANMVCLCRFWVDCGFGILNLNSPLKKQLGYKWIQDTYIIMSHIRVLQWKENYIPDGGPIRQQWYCTIPNHWWPHSSSARHHWGVVTLLLTNLSRHTYAIVLRMPTIPGAIGYHTEPRYIVGYTTEVWTCATTFTQGQIT